jgi:hypothetical protein
MTRVPRALREQVQRQAMRRCEYCRLPEGESPYPFHVEHIIAIQHDGLTDLDNLAWACLECNKNKGPNVASYDRESGELTPLFHPRHDEWGEHFEIIEGEILGKTAVGRVTARLLKMNVTQRVELRRALIAAGWW